MLAMIETPPHIDWRQPASLMIDHNVGVAERRR